MDEANQNPNRIPGLAYALMENGIEFPVLDVTHPRFVSSIDEERLDEVRKVSSQKMKALGELDDSQKKAYSEQLSKSYIFGRVFMKDPADNFLNGMSTYIYKLGPDLLDLSLYLEFAFYLVCCDDLLSIIE